MAGQIPINFVTQPSVSLRAACFGNNVYDKYSAAKCISNLLAIGYRRLLVDLYWSAERRSWSFCPVSVPVGVNTTATPPAATGDAEKRVITAVTGSSGSQLYQIGPYLCSEDLDVSGLIDILNGYFQSTTSQLNVYIQYVIFNLHSAAKTTSPEQPALAVSGAELPTDKEHLGYLLDDSLGQYIYGPDQLADERSNLNNSWYRVTGGYEPITEYFTIHEDSRGRQSTPDGWPCSKYVQLAKERRILFGYGDIDPQLEDYDLTSENTLFPPSYLTNFVNVSSAMDGSLDRGCFYDPDAYLVSQVNSSWAESTKIPVPSGLNISTLGQLSDMVTNLTECGLSPNLNDTLLGVTADKDIAAYRNISLSASWAWAAGEPRDSLTENAEDSPDRCAILDLSTGARWEAIGCGETRRAACRVYNLPFTWKLSTEATSFSNAGGACPENTTFSVPRTGLENTYFYRYLLSLESDNTLDSTSPDPEMRQVWVDFNSLDIASCWVKGGPEARCPYASDPQQLQKKTVLVATIWGIVICVVAALTLFVKCNANQRNSRRRKRVIEGWEYEGVPS